MFALSQPVAHAGNLGVGFVVGEPTALSLKIDQPASHAITFRTAWYLNGDPEIYLSGDFTFYNNTLFDVQSDEVSLPVYYGMGGWAMVDDFDRFGGRIPLGLSLRLSDVPLEIFMEIDPTLTIYPQTGFDMRGGVGVHIYP